MLEELTIRNLALIDAVSLRFGPGMNCLSGETGAGKSILAGALGLLRGNKGEMDQIRTGAEEGMVSAVFSLDAQSEAGRWLVAHELELDEGRLIVKRVLRRNGKGSLYIQGQPASLKDLTELSACVFDMHGQHEHQNLFNTDMHRVMLDRFGGLEDVVQLFYQEFSRLAALYKKREQLLEDERDLSRKQDYLSFALQEIQQAKPAAGEDAELEQERKIAMQAEKLSSLCVQACEGLSEGEGGGLSVLFSAKHALLDLAAIDPSLKELSARLDSVYYELQDISRSVQGYQDNASFDPARTDVIEERLALLSRLKKKYGGDLAAVCAFAEQAAQELAGLESIEETKAALGKQIQIIEAKVFGMAADLSVKRREAKERLKQVVETGLAGLGMAKARFDVALTRKESERGTPVCGPYGYDAIEFLMSANPGEPLRSIRSVASGGELSRVMLAIKSALADSDKVSTLVFDEVDTGIGGEVAVAVGEHLHNLSASKQILAITHLASIAVRADTQYKVLKKHADGRTVTEVNEVRSQERVSEVARMLSGDSSGEASLRHAQEMLDRYHRVY